MKQSFNKNPLIFGTRLTYKLLKGQKNPSTGRWVRDELISMGPTYIKIGQIISSRPDTLSLAEAVTTKKLPFFSVV